MSRGLRRLLTHFQKSDPPESIKLEILCEALNKPAQVTSTIEFFNAHFSQIDYSRISGQLEHAITLLFNAGMAAVKYSKPNFTFLGMCIPLLNNAEAESEVYRNVLQFMGRYLERKKCKGIEESRRFVAGVFECKPFLEFLALPKVIGDVFQMLFVEYDCFYADFVIEHCSIGESITKRDFSNFTAKVLEAFEKREVKNFERSATFVLKMGVMLKDAKFVGDLLNVIGNDVLQMRNIECIGGLLDSGLASGWKFLERAWNEKDVTDDAIRKIMSVLHERKESPRAIAFSYARFGERLANVADAEMMGDCVCAQNMEQRVEFVMSLSPPWNYKVNRSVFKRVLVSVDVGDELLAKTLLDPSEKEIAERMDDDNIETVDYMVANIRSDSSMWDAFSDRIFRWAMDSVKGSREWVSVIVRNMGSMHMSHLIDLFVDSVKDGKNTEALLVAFTPVCFRCDAFVQRVVRECSAILVENLESCGSLDFFAALVCNGPYNAVDECVKDHDHVFQKFEEGQLVKLMMGMPQSSDGGGLLRIPSLCRFVDNFELKTPFDRYVFGKYGTKYRRCEKVRSDYVTHYVRNLHSATVDEMCSSMKDSFPHFPVYQFHQDMPHATARVDIEGTVCFWFYIESLSGPTVIASAVAGDILMESDGLTVFGGKKTPCTLKEWHMIVINFSDTTTVIGMLSYYIDGERLTQRRSGWKDGSTLTFGSEMSNNGIWYLAPTIQSGILSLTSEQVEKLHIKPCYRTERYSRIACVDCGCKYVEYAGPMAAVEGCGGKEAVFIRMLKEESKETFMKLVECAFWLFSNQAIEPELFVGSFRHVIMTHGKWCDDIFLVNAFRGNESVLVKVLCDFQILTSPSIDFNFLHVLIYNDIPMDSLFDYILDVVCSFEILSGVQAVFISVLAVYVKMESRYLMKVLIMGASFGIEDSVKRRLLLEMCFADETLICNVFKETKCKRMLNLCRSMDKGYGSRLMNLVFRHSVVDRIYLDSAWLERNLAILLQLLQHMDDLWISLVAVTFATEIANFDYTEDQLNKLLPRKRVMLEILLDAVAYSMRHKMQNGLTPSTELAVIRYVDAVGKDSILVGFPKQLIQICCMGFDMTTPIVRSRSSIMDSRRRINTPMLQCVKILRADPTMHESYKRAIANATVLDERFRMPNPGELESLDQVIDDPAIDVALTSLAKAFAVAVKAPVVSKTEFSKYTLASKTVYSRISVKMHIRIVKKIFALPRTLLSEGTWTSLMEFLVTQVLADKWDGREVELVTMLLPVITARMKWGRELLRIAMSRCRPDRQNELLLEIFKQFGSNLAGMVKEQAFLEMLENIVCQPELLGYAGFDQVKEKIVAICEGTPFADALNDNRTLVWFASLGRDNIGESPSGGWLDSAESDELKRRIPVTDDDISDVATVLTKAVRYQFLYRLTKSNAEVEYVIGRLFKSSAVVNSVSASRGQSSMVIGAPTPLCVSQKVVPCVFPFKADFGKPVDYVIPHSIHVSRFSSVVPELNMERTAALCLDGWNLPAYSSAAATAVLKDLIGPELDTCHLLSTPEEMSCVYSLGKRKMHILMNAKIVDDSVELMNSSKMLCHYVGFEMPFYGYYGDFRLFCHHVILSLRYSDIVLTVKRRSAYQQTLVDVFLVNGIRHSIRFESESARSAFRARLKTTKRRHVKCGIHYASGLLSRPIDSLTARWVDGRMSTFDYLIYLNIVGGRSFNDLSQYPVLPWIVCPEGEEQDGVRDMSKPMGAQTETRVKRIMAAYNETKYHHGTHYSHSAAVLHFMIRIQPFTFFAIHLHNGWDHKDRLFCSVSESWRSSGRSHQADVMELVPEFYAFPIMFEDVNNLMLGERSDGHDLNKVELPSWAKSSEHFVSEMRTTLDADENISQWIDLIFGYKQQGHDAIDAVNVFHPATYDTSFKERVESGINVATLIDEVHNFGQCPLQLFTSPHPRRQCETTCDLDGPNLYISELSDGPDDVKFVHVVDAKILSATASRFVYDLPLRTIHLPCESVKYCVSTDRSLFAIYRAGWEVGIYSGTGRITSICTCTDLISHMALSSQHAILAVAEDSSLCLFDVGTGILMQTASTSESVRHITFDETACLILVVTLSHIAVFSLRLRLIAGATSDVPFTYITSCDSGILPKSPFFFTGHDNGDIMKWHLDIPSGTLIASSIARAKSSVSAMCVFSNGQALVSSGVSGDRLLVSSPITKHRLLDRMFYATCPVCSTTVNPLLTCSTCGRVVCMSCSSQQLPTVVCSSCAL